MITLWRRSRLHDFGSEQLRASVARAAEILSLPRTTLCIRLRPRPAPARSPPRSPLTGIINSSRALRRFRLAEFGRPILHEPGSQGLASRRANGDQSLGLI